MRTSSSEVTAPEAQLVAAEQVRIPLAAHPSNNDPSAVLVSSSRDPNSIFRVKGGFVAVIDGWAFATLFPDEHAARAAIARATGAAP